MMPGVLQPLRPVYKGKFTDMDPVLCTAGKLVPMTGSVLECLTEVQPRPITPPRVKKFFNSRNPNPGTATTFYGKANDPDIASLLQHGVSSKPSHSVASLINPPIRTRVQHIFSDKITAAYPSHRRAPLGKSHDQTAGLPKGLNIYNTTFGKRVIKDITAGELVNPPKTRQQVYDESQSGHSLYIVTHNDYNVGEPVDRKYDWSRISKESTFGVETPFYNDGRMAAKSLHWLTEVQQQKSAKVISKKIDDFREKTHHQVGKGLDPIVDTLKIPSDHTFGVLLHPDEFGVGDLIYNRTPIKFCREKDRERGNLTAIRHHLKKTNFQNFKSLLEAFRHYDKNGDGKIDREELQDVCLQFNLNLNPRLMDELFDYCDLEGVGSINFLEFANFLNWKDKMLLGEIEQKIITKGNATNDDGCGLVASEDIVPLEIGSSIKTLRTITRKEDKSNGHYRTSSSLINAVVSSYSPKNFQTHGVPTIRSDLAAPRFRRISDTINYGDEATASALLNPSIFAQRQVYEKDLFLDRTKEETLGRPDSRGTCPMCPKLPWTSSISWGKTTWWPMQSHPAIESIHALSQWVNYVALTKAQQQDPKIPTYRTASLVSRWRTSLSAQIKQIFCKAGVDMSREIFEKVWKHAATKRSKGEVCVESFREVLDEMQTSNT
ncbi:EF-hand domain-containing family member B isoform X2 [Narcine bancroftii]|uniref:EF-hand domain-containing family member B isoform X2 n=1 Tax=Narcine bancroftii TaxID=1343680 RepID=UPI003831193D